MLLKTVFSLIFYLILLQTNVTKEINNRPIIGILTIPYRNTKNSYVEDSYIKMVEASGAKAIPIRWNSSKRIIDFLLNSVNGVLIQGDYSPKLVSNARKLFNTRKNKFQSIDETAFYILTKAFEFNKNGIYFPILMDNYGFGFVFLNLSKNKDIFTDINADNYNSNLIFNDIEISKTEISTLISSSKNKNVFEGIIKEMKDKKSFKMENVQKFRMFRDFDLNELNTVFYNQTMHFDINYGVLLRDFYVNKQLVYYINPTSFAFDKHNNLTISSFEFKDFPIYGTHFQIDKILYKDNVHHSLKNIQINRKFTDFFVEESKKNYQKFTDKRSESTLIFENFKLRYDHNKKTYIYVIREEDDEYDNVDFVNLS